MIHAQTINLEAIREDETKIYEHIGRFTAAAAQMDQALTAMLGWMTGARDPDAAQAMFVGEQVSVKLRLLERAIPADWDDKKLFFKAIDKVQDYRNRLAHSIVASHIVIGTGEVNFYSKRERKTAAQETINLSELRLWESRISAVNLALFALTHSRNQDIRAVSLRDLAQSVFPETGEAIQAGIDEMFPAASRQTAGGSQLNPFKKEE